MTDGQPLNGNEVKNEGHEKTYGNIIYHSGLIERVKDELQDIE